MTISTPTPARDDEYQTTQPNTAPQPSARIGWIVLGSLAIGAVAALLFAAAPFVRPQGSEITGAVLCGFALGWAMLALLSERFTDQPQRWAAAPAVFFGSSGVLLVIFGSPVDAVLRWIWPPVLLALTIWMFLRARRTLRSQAARVLLYPVIVLMGLASIGGGYQTIGEAVDAATHPMPGKLVEVNGHRLHLSCTGSGTPTVILEPGAGGMSSVFGWVQPEVARDTRVCAYDRVNRGWSDPGPTVEDGKQIAGELHEMLLRADVQGPYVLAGHSFGGLYVRTFAAAYPGEVAGMVLIDSTAAASEPAPPAATESYDLMERAVVLLSTTARLGLARLIIQFDFDTLPPASRDGARASGAREDELASTMAEYLFADASIRQAAAFKDFGDKPLVVLTAGTGSEPGWSEKQEAMAALSTNSARRVVPGATHGSMVSEPEHAAYTTEAILDVVAAARNTSQVPD